MPRPLEGTNDFVVKFANVNGSGSASANRLFAKSILRMGVPISSRNIFPSNIQGLPTWYEVRVSGAGYLGRRGGVDLMVAMNPQTWDKDVAGIEPGGYLFYDSTKPVPPAKQRDDINVVGVPLTEISQSGIQRPAPASAVQEHHVCGRLVGAAGYGLGRDRASARRTVHEQGQAARSQQPRPPYRSGLCADPAEMPPRPELKRAQAVGSRIFIDGNSAAALGCVYGGATVAAWYPITPSTSLAEAFMRFCRRYRTDPDLGKNRFSIVQAEDELASIGIVIGAAWNGARAFTATSGPGISLMQEFLGLAYFAEVPAVIFDVQRGGPSTGMPTRTQQSDVLACAYASHGDTKQVLLIPADPSECFEFAALAFDLADRLQTPIFVMLDLDIGMNEWLSSPFAWDDARRMDRGKIMSPADLDSGKEFGRYLDVDGDGIAYRTYPGTHPTRGAYFTRGSSKDAFARYTEEGAAYVENMQRLQKKFGTARNLVPAPVQSTAHRAARFGVIYYGSTAPAMEEALDSLQDHGAVLDSLRLRAFPFQDEVANFISRFENVFVVEQNRDGQMRMLLVNECGVDPAKLLPILHYDGTPITARFIIREIAGRLASLNVAPFRRGIG